METAAEQCDVAVIGGGPAGSTAAALLARRGYRVIALEKAHHPRFHIGESLLPMNLPIFERLGVLEKVRALGVFKRGADFEADNERGYNTFAFDRALGKSPPHAYQVWRQDFDRMLYAHARECGADTREGHEAISIEQRSPRDSCLVARLDPVAPPLVGEATAAKEERAAPERGDLRALPRRGRAAGRGCGQHQHVPLRARLDVDDPAAGRRDERGRGVLAGLPEAAQGPHARVPARDPQAQ